MSYAVLESIRGNRAYILGGRKYHDTGIAQKSVADNGYCSLLVSAQMAFRYNREFLKSCDKKLPLPRRLRRKLFYFQILARKKSGDTVTCHDPVGHPLCSGSSPSEILPSSAIGSA